MSNPLAKLRRILAPTTATRGLVVAVEDGVVKVATRRGLVEYSTFDGVRAGDSVVITTDGRIIACGVATSIYWV